MFGLMIVNRKRYKELLLLVKKYIEDEAVTAKELKELRSLTSHFELKENSTARNFDKVISLIESEEAKLTLVRKIINTMQAKELHGVRNVINIRSSKLKKVKDSQKGEDNFDEIAYRE